MKDDRPHWTVRPATSESPTKPGPSEATGKPARGTHSCQNADDPSRICMDTAEVRVLRSDELLQGERELLIVHGSQIYRLLRTRNDKLILQK